jgi:iron complex transport system ATP-binding protein
MLTVDRLTVRYGNLTVLRDIGFSLREGGWLMVVGPNGAGKSTLINAVSQGVPYTGTVRVLGEDAKRLRPHALARRIGVLAQRHPVGYAFTVEEVVGLGRYAYSPSFLWLSQAEDEERIEAALAMTGLLPLRKQSVLTLSGGELQRAFLAQIFAQDPRILLLDEPTNHLDLVYQKQTFEVIGDWLRKPGRAVISVVHDLSLARAYGTDAMLLSMGGLVACGQTREVLTREKLQSVYAVDVYGWMRAMLSQWQE